MAIPDINDTYPVAPLENLFNLIGNAAEADIAALTPRSPNALFKVNDLAGLSAITTEINGDLAYSAEGQFILTSNGTVWTQATIAKFASTAARDTAFAKASGAYQITGARATVGTLHYRYINTPDVAVAGWYPEQGGGPRCVLLKTGAQSTAGAGVFAAAVWDLEDYDTQGMHDNLSNPSRVTAVVPGYYSVRTLIRLGSTTGVGTLEVRKNGTLVQALREQVTGAATQGIYLNAAGIVFLAAGDYIETFVTSTVATQPYDITTCRLEVTYVSAV